MKRNMNQKGITLASIIVMIIVMILIATVSIVAGNRLILNSKDYVEEQELESVRSAVLRKKNEIGMMGSMTPIGEMYVGTADPTLQTATGRSVVATNWYLLDEGNLEELGVFDTTSRFLVSYEYEVVLPVKNPDYVEEYLVVQTMQDLKKEGKTIGMALQDTYGQMVRNLERNELFGSGWYLVKAEDWKDVTSEEVGADITHSYVIQFDRAEYEKVTSQFEGVGFNL